MPTIAYNGYDHWTPTAVYGLNNYILIKTLKQIFTGHVAGEGKG